MPIREGGEFLALMIAALRRRPQWETASCCNPLAGSSISRSQQARLRWDGRALEFAGAGHPPAMIVQPGEPPRLLESQNRARGLLELAVNMASFGPFLAVVEKLGPTQLARLARDLQPSAPESWSELLIACWGATESSPALPEEFLACAFLQPLCKQQKSGASWREHRFSARTSKRGVGTSLRSFEIGSQSFRVTGRPLPAASPENRRG